MRRLTRTHAAFRRAMQMSRIELFAFVEGRVDRFFYGIACEHVCGGTATRYRVVPIAEVCGDGGKTNLIGLFAYLRSRGSLFDDFKGKRTATIFFADKDLDDFKRRKLRSDHLVYTEYYNVENHVFRHGDLIHASAVVASLDLPTVRAAVGDPATWCARVASLWSDWTKLCFHAVLKDIRCMCTYSVPSRINPSPLEAVDPLALGAAIATLEGASLDPPAIFRAHHVKVASKVDALFDSGQHDLVFNGKWYSKLLASRLLAIKAKPPVDPRALEDRLIDGMAGTLNFREPWAARFTDPIAALVARL